MWKLWRQCTSCQMEPRRAGLTSSNFYTSQSLSGPFFARISAYSDIHKNFTHYDKKAWLTLVNRTTGQNHHQRVEVKSRISSSPTSLAYRSNSCLFLSPCLCQKRDATQGSIPLWTYWFDSRSYERSLTIQNSPYKSNHQITFIFGPSKAWLVHKITQPTPHGTFWTGSQLLQSWVIWDVQNSNIDWSTTKSNTRISLAFSNGGGVPKKRWASKMFRQI